MDVYQTDSDGFLVGITQADPDPENPGEYLFPGGCVGTPPPALGANESARWQGGAWVKVPDHRGRVYWLADGSRHEIAQRGVAPPAGALDEAPVLPRFTTMTEALAGRKADCDALAVKKRAIITSGISPAEMASWPIKRSEALAYQASGNAADASMLQMEADARGVTLASLVAKVLANATTLSQMEAQIAGNNGKHNDALDALAAAPGATVDQMLAYDITIGWPV